MFLTTIATNSIGKGFQGAMKRHGFSGLRATHGVSISHRSPGSTGQHQDPGRVFPGKKMAGRMGGKSHTTQNLLLLRVDNALNLLYVKGAVPGHDGAFIRVKDSLKKKVVPGKNGVLGLPFPACTQAKIEEWQVPDELTLEIMSKHDPHKPAAAK